MDKLSKSHVLILSLLAALLLITPILSSNLRPTYLYFITNILIIALSVEAGLISFFFNNNNAGTKNPKLSQAHHAAVALDGDQFPWMIMSYGTISNKKAENIGDYAKVMGKCLSEKVGMTNVGGKEVKKFKKCPSMPSLFFIGGAPEAETGDNGCEFDFDSDEEDEPVDEGIISGQELFTKAETFIGNFYKQLKMQREESWKKIHGIYQKAF